MPGNESLGPFTSAPILALVQFGILRAQPRLHGISHVADLLTALLDGSRLTSLDRAAASGSTRLFDRVAHRLQNDPQLPTSVLRHRLARALNVAIERDDLVMVQRIHDLHPEPLDVESLATAIEFGSLETVQWVVENRCDRRCCPPGIQNLCRTCLVCAVNVSDGRIVSFTMRDAMRVIPWLFEGGSSPYLGHISVIARPLRVLFRRNLDLLKWAMELDFLTPARAEALIIDMIAYGPAESASILKFVLDKGFTVGRPDFVWQITRTSFNPTLEPIIDVVVESHLCDSFRDKFVYASLRPGGSKVLQWDIEFMKKVETSSEFTVFDDFARMAFDFGHVDAVEWFSRHCNPNIACMPLLGEAPEQEVIKIYERLHSNNSAHFVHWSLMNVAASRGQLKVVQWLANHTGDHILDDYMDSAAEGGHLSVLQWLHENEIGVCTTRAMDKAAQNGHLDVIQWLHANRREGCTAFAMAEAAEKGHLHVVRWLAANRTENNPTMALARTGCFPSAGRWIFEYKAVLRETGCFPSAIG